MSLGRRCTSGSSLAIGRAHVSVAFHSYQYCVIVLRGATEVVNPKKDHFRRLLVGTGSYDSHRKTSVFFFVEVKKEAPPALCVVSTLSCAFFFCYFGNARVDG